jgi:hypothetical protein
VRKGRAPEVVREQVRPWRGPKHVPVLQNGAPEWIWIVTT